MRCCALLCTQQVVGGFQNKTTNFDAFYKESIVTGSCITLLGSAGTVDQLMGAYVGSITRKVQKMFVADGVSVADTGLGSRNLTGSRTANTCRQCANIQSPTQQDKLQQSKHHLCKQQCNEAHWWPRPKQLMLLIMFQLQLENCNQSS
jgi:hypothetical protein